MIINLIDKLIDRCIQSIKHSREVKKNLFNDFVTPIYQEFELVHNEYIKSFKGYRDIIKSSEDFSSICDSLCDKIDEDILFNAGSRAKLIEIVKVMKSPTINSFIYHIYSYVVDAVEIVWGEDETISFKIFENGTSLVRGQLWRNALSKELLQIKLTYHGNDAKNHALTELDSIVQNMQYQYSKVTSSYANLKQELAQ